MPTNHDETLHERYAREHQAHLAIYARMTPEQISDMATELHNALARLAALSQQAKPTDTFTAVDMATAAAQGFRDGQAAVEPAPAQDEREHVPDKVFQDEFKAWWEDHGQFCRAGGGDYERSFAFQAWRHLYPMLMQARAARPAQTEQQPVVYAVHGKGLAVDRDCALISPDEAGDYMPGCVTALYAAPIAQTAPHESKHHAQLLGQALGECIAAAGIIRPDASLSGPELLMFADDLKRHLAEQTAPQPEQDDSLNMEPEGANAYLVVDPDDNYHICYVVRSKDLALQHASGGLVAFGPLPGQGQSNADS